jgi:RNA polymerase sigma-70 factor (ECF subfamily)
MHDSPDAGIVERVLGGEVDAFEALVERYERYVFAIVSRHVPGDAVAEVAHDAFLGAYRSLPKLRDPDQFKSWLAGIAVRTCYQYLRTEYRKRKRTPASLEDTDASGVTAAADELAEHRHRRSQNAEQASELVSWALDKLTPAERMVVSLLHLEQHSVQETASLMGISTANVKVRAFRARRQLRRILESETPGGGR